MGSYVCTLTKSCRINSEHSRLINMLFLLRFYAVRYASIAVISSWELTVSFQTQIRRSVPTLVSVVEQTCRRAWASYYPHGPPRPQLAGYDTGSEAGVY